MKILAPTKEDFKVLDEIYEKYYKSQFDKTDFTKDFLSSFVVKDDNDKIVLGGGVRPLAETILVTDKEANLHTIGDGLLEALRFSMFTCARFNIKLLHAFVKDEDYTKHLIAHGFKKRCQALYIGV